MLSLQCWEQFSPRWNRAHWFGIDRLQASVRVYIDSWQDCAHWLGIDRLQVCVRVDIDNWQDRAHWFGIDRLQASVRVDIDNWRDRAHWFGIDRFQACVLVDIDNWRDRAHWFGIDSKVRLSFAWTDSVLDQVLRVRHTSSILSEIRKCWGLRFKKLTF